jgi:predicted nucleic acid-binding protein
VGTRALVDRVPERITAWSLGAGESEVLALTLANPGATAVLDDGEARACARVLGLPVIGTLGIVLMAKRRSLVGSASEIVAALVRNGFRVSDQVVTEALRAVGEEWQ